MIRKVYIVRGVQGSGKSTYSKELKCYHKRCQISSEEVVPQVKIFSADDYWINPETGKYEFDVSKLGVAHKWCQLEFDKFLNSFMSNESFVAIVDNTNITKKEILPYVEWLDKTTEFEIVTVYCDPAKAAARNLHGVPPQIVFNKYIQMMSAELPREWKQTVYQSE